MSEGTSMTRNHCKDCGSFAPKGMELCEECRPPTDGTTADAGQDSGTAGAMGPLEAVEYEASNSTSDASVDVDFEDYRTDAMFWFFVGLALVGAGLLLLWVMLP